MTKNVEIYGPAKFEGMFLSATKAFNSLKTTDDVPLSDIFDGIHEFRNVRTLQEVREMRDSMVNHPATIGSKEVYAIRLIGQNDLVKLPEVELVVNFETPFSIHEATHHSELSQKIYDEVCNHGMNELPEIYGMRDFEDLRPVNVMLHPGDGTGFKGSPKSYQQNDKHQIIQGTYKVHMECAPTNHTGSAWIFLGVTG